MAEPPGGEPPPLLALSAASLHHVASQLGHDAKSLCSLQQTCRELRAECVANTLWGPLLKQAFDINVVLVGYSCAGTRRRWLRRGGA